MWNDFIFLLKVLVVTAGARAFYEAIRSRDLKTGGCQGKLTATKNSANVRIETFELPLEFKELAKKSVEKYALAQEKKWRNWARSLSK